MKLGTFKVGVKDQNNQSPQKMVPAVGGLGYAALRWGSGDFNARNTLWNDTITNTRGRQLDSWMCANVIKCKATLISPDKLTYPKAGSFLDHCIMDMQLHTVNLVDASPQHYNYKKANWRKFNNYLEKNIQNQNSIPHDRNLSIYEIDQYILNIEKIITEAIKITILKNTPEATNYYQKYVNKTIKKLHSYKSFLLTRLFRNTPYSRQDNNKTKKTIRKINKLLQTEFRRTVTAYWEGQVKNIDYRNPHKFFPNINRFLRPKKTTGIDTLRVQADNSQLSIYAQTNFQHLIKDNSVIFTDPEDKLLIIGKYLESINSPRYTNTNTKTKKIVDTTVNNLRILKHKIRNKDLTFTEFSPENLAYDPKEVVCGLKIFFKILDITTILAKLKNKTSSGLDNIPTVVLKNLPLKLIMNYTIIFNNAINNAYYPSSTLVIPQKKTVKYLGVTLDHLLRLKKHHSIQLNKAKIAIKANCRIFYNSNLEARAKVICYQLLIRPLLTYVAPVLAQHPVIWDQQLWKSIEG
ncbi:hypothetical protein M0802_014235 [Mischocyttarus mexicanus]|nr:hypothetical protein M0802_014235 [Mischocyttarus mexicanus]